jgi:tetratricopeptide (TPR) repeat protein
MINNYRLILKKGMIHSSVFNVVFLFLFSITSLVAQTNFYDLKAIWENPKNADSTRFNALAEYYKLNNQVQPDTTLKVLVYYHQLAKEKNNIKELYKVANNRGGIYRLKEELDLSLRYYQEAEKLAIKLNDPALKATIAGNIGSVYANKKDYTKALQCFTNSFAVYKKVNDKNGESRMLSSIGNVYLYIQNYELALEYYQKALTTIKNIDVPKRSIAVIYLNIGWTYYEIKKYKEAKIYNEKALKILEKTGDKFFLVSAYSTLARIHLELNEFKLATNYAEKSLTLSKELNVSGLISETQIIFAQLDLRKGNIEAARKNGEAILIGLDKNASLNHKLNLYDLLYKCYQAEDNPEKSLKMYQKYTFYKDSILLEKNKFTLIREVIKSEFDDLLQKNKLEIEREKAKLESVQLRKTYGIIIGSIILIGLIFLYFNRNLRKNRKKRDELLQEIEILKNSGTIITTDTSKTITPETPRASTIDAPRINETFELNRIRIESAINRKLNETDWNVLNLLLQNPVSSNKEIASQISMSVDGVGSSLRRMYEYFEIRESKYKKTDLIRKAIQISTNH